jgi:hypothetical protein
MNVYTTNSPYFERTLIPARPHRAKGAQAQKAPWAIARLPPPLLAPPERGMTLQTRWRGIL